MSGPTRPPRGGTPRQPWTPDQAPKGVTCPACGLANEPGARVCRNCGLPIASSDDPLRGVAPGRVDLPGSRRSGLSATVGLALVIGLLLLGGTLAVSGGGILSTGGRLGVTATPSPQAGAGGDPAGSSQLQPSASGKPGVIDQGSTGVTTSFDYTCDADAIKDFSRGKWFISQATAGARDDHDQVVWQMSRTSDAKAKNATTVTLEWMEPREAQSTFGIRRVSGDRAIVITFDGPVDITADQSFDQASLEGENIAQIRNIQMFEGQDGTVRTVIGLKGDSCVRMEARGWNKKSRANNARVELDIERF